MNEKLIIEEEKRSKFLDSNQSNKNCMNLTDNEKLGYSLQLGSFQRFYNSVVDEEDAGHFAFLYSLGNVLAMIGTTIYVGWDKQIEIMTDPQRYWISLIFIASLLFCLIFPFFYQNKFAKLLTALAIIIQTASYWYYSLTFFPKIQQIFQNIKSLFKKREQKINQFFNNGRRMP